MTAQPWSIALPLGIQRCLQLILQSCKSALCLSQFLCEHPKREDRINNSVLWTITILFDLCPLREHGKQKAWLYTRMEKLYLKCIKNYPATSTERHKAFLAYNPAMKWTRIHFAWQVNPSFYPSTADRFPVRDEPLPVRAISQTALSTLACIPAQFGEQDPAHPSHFQRKETGYYVHQTCKY